MAEIRLLTIDNIHEKTGISHFTLQKYCREGQLKAVKRARQWFIREEDYNAFFTPESKPSTNTHKG